MRFEDIREILEAAPFKPFRLHMTEGKVFEVTHPELVILTRWKLIIGLPQQEGTRVVEHVEHCGLIHVVRVEELQADAA